jgi:hypothetical protein
VLREHGKDASKGSFEIWLVTAWRFIILWSLPQLWYFLVYAQHVFCRWHDLHSLDICLTVMRLNDYGLWLFATFEPVAISGGSFWLLLSDIT